MTAAEPSSPSKTDRAPPDGALLAELGAALALRERQLRARLQRGGHALPEGDTAHEVADLKDLAAGDAQTVVDDAEAEGLRQQLARVVRARHRAREHRYGLCLACGMPIDTERLRALPEAELCLPCQSAQEAARRSPPLR